MLGRLIALVLASATVCHAHDPYEAWASANVHPEHLVLIVTMAQSTATRLVDPEGKTAAITPQNYASLEPRLVNIAKSLFVLTAARKALAPREAKAELTEENDIVLTITYPRSPAGALHFHAAFLEKLGQGYGSMLEVLEGGSKDLGWEKLSSENPNFEVVILAR